MLKRKLRWLFLSKDFETLEYQIPMNSLKVFKIGGYDVCVGRNSKGFYAIKDKCPHQGYSFKGGSCTEKGQFVCPIHKYGFDVKDGSGGGTAGIIYQIEERKDGVYVGISYISLF